MRVQVEGQLNRFFCASVAVIMLTEAQVRGIVEFGAGEATRQTAELANAVEQLVAGAGDGAETARKARCVHHAVDLMWARLRTLKTEHNIVYQLGVDAGRAAESRSWWTMVDAAHSRRVELLRRLEDAEARAEDAEAANGAEVVELNDRRARQTEKHAEIDAGLAAAWAEDREKAQTVREEVAEPNDRLMRSEEHAQIDAANAAAREADAELAKAGLEFEFTEMVIRASTVLDGLEAWRKRAIAAELRVANMQTELERWQLRATNAERVVRNPQGEMARLVGLVGNAEADVRHIQGKYDKLKIRLGQAEDALTNRGWR